jgi:hypothetical protein
MVGRFATWQRGTGAVVGRVAAWQWGSDRNPHRLTASLPHCLTASLPHRLTASLPHCQPPKAAATASSPLVDLHLRGTRAAAVLRRVAKGPHGGV